LFENCVDPTNQSANVLGVGCHLLVTELPGDRNFVRGLYIEKMLEACAAPSGENIGHPACVKLIREQPIDAFPLRQFLKGFCSDKVNNSAYTSICGCFYPDSFYNNLRKDLGKFYDIPDNLLLGGRQCLWPDCHNSPLKDNPDEPPCDELQLFQCIQTINFTSTGNLTDVTFHQYQQCGDIQRRDICDPACEAPKVCMAGNVCADPDKCTRDADCGPNGTMSCEDGVCVDKPKKYWPIILGILLGLLALGVAGFVFWKWRKNKASASAESSSE
jgi:LPXTG-motif cell wall-anchored protein